ncbi:MAG: 6-phosphofructokinase [Microthrixaceae bacterium]|nr:6-phosphofructokinase [Microthrixaceae bacterium]
MAAALEERTDGAFEARATVLGHLQRGGQPSPIDTILATEYGIHAVDLVAQDHFDTMVALRGTRIEPVPLADVVAAGSALVDPTEELAHTARSVGIYLGDNPLN